MPVAHGPGRRPAADVRLLERVDQRVRDRRDAPFAHRPPLAKAHDAVVRGDYLADLGVIEMGDALHASTLRKHRGDLPGAPATGHRTSLSGITIERFEDGKVVEWWRGMDMLRLLGSVGAIPAAAGEVVIKARHNGPYKVTGPVKVIDADGDEYDLSDRGEAVALCRCGGSTTKPFCDGTHSKVGFQAAERVVRESL
jgi:CDGSH-type Zn-finger protein